MTKKILLVLLVVLMVGILAFSVFACKKDPAPTPNKPNNPDDGGDDIIDDTDYFSLMIEDVIAAIDNTVANVNDIDTAASVNAEIYVDVVVGQDAYNVKLNVSGSIDKNAKAKNWALIEADVLGVKVNLFAVNNGQVEDLYIAQNVLNENVKWNKLSQFEQANVLSNLACNSIIDLVAGLDETTVTNIENGLVNSLAGDILGMLPLISGFGLFAPVEGGAKDFTTADGYQTTLQLGAISDLLGSTMISGIIAGLPADYHGIISTAVGLLLGGDLKFETNEKTGVVSATYTPGAAEDTPTIELGFGVKDDLFTGLVLSYALPELSVEFGIKNLALSGASKAAPAPYGTVAPEELAIALNLDLTAQGITADTMTAQVAIYPNVAMTFDNDGYVDFDFSELYAVATANIAGENYTIAEYNVDGQEDLIIDLSSIADVTGAEVPATLFKVPVNLNEKFDAMIAEQKAPKTEGEAQNAINGKNVVDYVIADVIPGLFNEDGSFNIGAVVGVLGQLPAIIEEITPILETEGLFSYELGEDEATANATLNLEVLMDALLVEDGIIDTIEGEWNSFSLHFYQKEEGHWEGEYGSPDRVYIVDVEESYEVKEMTLAQLLAPEAVIDNIVAFVNSAMYDNYLKNFVPATEGEEALGYIEYFDSADAPVEFTKTLLTQTLAGVTGASLDENDAYTNMSISVNGYAQDGIGFGLEATLGEEVKTFGLALGLEIIENVAVEDYTQKIFFDETYGIGVSYDAEYNPVNTTIYNDTGKDGGKLLAYTALQLASAIVNFLPNYVDAPFEYVMMEGSDASVPKAVEIVDGKIAFDVEGAYFVSIELAADSTVTFAVADGSNIKMATYCAAPMWDPTSIVPVYPVICGTEVDYDWEAMAPIAVLSGSFEAPAGTLIIYVETVGAGVLNVTIA